MIRPVRGRVNLSVGTLQRISRCIPDAVPVFRCGEILAAVIPLEEILNGFAEPTAADEPLHFAEALLVYALIVVTDDFVKHDTICFDV